MLHPIIQTTLAAAAALTAIGFAANANAAGGDFACGVTTQTQGGMLAVQGKLMSRPPLTANITSRSRVQAVAAPPISTRAASFRPRPMPKSRSARSWSTPMPM
jgi:hypothetical protein